MARKLIGSGSTFEAKLAEERIKFEIEVTALKR